MRYPRDMHGHGEAPPQADWPGGAAVCVQVVLNFEEGGENCILHGDAASEAFLSEIVGAAPWPGMRHWNMESIYEYGARAGFWRLRRLFTERAIPLTVFGVATALARAPAQVAAMKAAGWEIASHGLKWIDYRDHARDAEKADLDAAIRLHAAAVGERPAGWYLGRCSVNTVDLVSAEGGFAYVADSYADDLPYWREHAGRAQLIVPYTLDANDMRFATPQGFNTGEDFFIYLRDALDAHLAEGRAGRPSMMSVGLHCRLAGRPGRAAGLARFLDHAQAQGDVWFATRLAVARHWAQRWPWAPRARPSQMDRADFVAAYGSIFEHSPWIAERAWDAELAPAHDSAVGLWHALAMQFRLAAPQERLAVLRAHPDLAGRLAQARRLTADSTAEQAAAGLDALTDAERARFTVLNAAYVERFGFPFIIAVRDHDKGQILAAFERRLASTPAAELAAACAQVERIARLRLDALLP